MKLELKDNPWQRVLFAVFFGLSLFACSTTEVVPQLPPQPPAYTKVAHPNGNDLSDVTALFLDQSAPKEIEFGLGCDAEYRKLLDLTQNSGEREQGAREFVRSNPIYYHWCFYAKLLGLEAFLKKEALVSERQKQLLFVFEFLVPIAKAFNAEYRDSRYLRWTTNRYRKLSEWVFFRKLDLTPQGTMELVEPANPFGLWRKEDVGFSTLEKYHLDTAPIPMKSGAPVLPANSSESSSNSSLNPVMGVGASPATSSISDPILGKSLPIDAK